MVKCILGLDPLILGHNTKKRSKMKENNIAKYIQGYLYGVVLSLALFGIWSLYQITFEGRFISIGFVTPGHISSREISAIKETIAYENGLELIEVPQKRSK